MKTDNFDQFNNYRSGVFDQNGQKAHLRTKTFHLAYNQVSITFRSKVLARTSSSLEKPLFLAILANLTTSGRVF